MMLLPHQSFTHSILHGHVFLMTRSLIHHTENGYDCPSQIMNYACQSKEILPQLTLKISAQNTIMTSLLSVGIEMISHRSRIPVQKQVVALF